MSVSISSSIQLVQYFGTTSSITIADLPSSVLSNLKQIYRLSDTGGYQSWTKDGGKAFPALEYGKGYLFVSEDNATFPYVVNSDTENFPAEISITTSPAIVRYVGDSLDLSNTANTTNFQQIYKITNGQYSSWNKVGGKAFTTLDDGETYLVISEDSATFPYTFSTITAANNLHFLQNRHVRKVNSKTGTLEESVYIATNTYTGIHVDSVSGRTYVGDRRDLMVINHGSDKITRRLDLNQYGLYNITTIFSDSSKIYAASASSSILCVIDAETYDVVAYDVNDRVGIDPDDTISGVSSFSVVDDQIYVCPIGKNYAIVLEDIKELVDDVTLPNFESDNNDDSLLYVGFSDDLSRVATVEPEGDELKLSAFHVSDGALRRIGNPLSISGKNSTGFGSIIKISNDGTTIIVGAYKTNTSGINNGAAFVYNYNGSSWSETQGLFAGGNYDYFPDQLSMSTDGTWIIASAHLYSTNNEISENHGIVKIYKNTSSNASVREYTTSNTLEGSTTTTGLGKYAVLSGAGSVLAVSTQDPSAVKIYKLDNTTPSAPVWNLHDTIDTPTGRTVTSLDLNYNGDYIAISYSGDNGPVYVYEDDGSSWVRNKAIISSSAAPYSAGSSVSISNDGNRVCGISNINNKKYSTLYTYDSTNDDWDKIDSEDYPSTYSYNALFTNDDLDSFAHAYKIRTQFVSSGGPVQVVGGVLGSFALANSSPFSTVDVVLAKTHVEWKKEQ